MVILGDTCNSDALAQAAYGADLGSHEATFAKGMEDKAEIAQHSTALMAGQFARKINARQLVLTHFSPRYQYVSPMNHCWTIRIMAIYELLASDVVIHGYYIIS